MVATVAAKKSVPKAPKPAPRQNPPPDSLLPHPQVKPEFMRKRYR
jgi:hypothetical protein